MKNLWIFVILMFLLVSFISFSSAQEISFSAPSEVPIDQEFSVSLNLVDFSSGSYDVKIDVLDGSNRIAQILNGEDWKSTYYYLPEAITEGTSETFNLKIVKDFDTASIEIKVRSSSGVVKTFGGYEISYGGSQVSNSDTSNTNLNTETNTASQESSSPNSTQENLTQTIQELNNQINLNSNSNLENQNDNFSNEKIFLNSPNGNTENIEVSKNSVSSPKALNNKNNSVYYIVGFCLLLGLLIILKFGKKKRKNEFR